MKTGQATGVQVQVTQGLKVGDKVITEGGDRLRRRRQGPAARRQARRPRQGQGATSKGHRQRPQRPE
ncbi:hypothetical protein ACRAWD_21395 [Caulobacter segnis]